MTTEDNKRLAIALFERFTASDIPGALALMTEDVTWRVPGKLNHVRRLAHKNWIRGLRAPRRAEPPGFPPSTRL